VWSVDRFEKLFPAGESVENVKVVTGIPAHVNNFVADKFTIKIRNSMRNGVCSPKAGKTGQA
jgi:hypothetical protein